MNIKQIIEQHALWLDTEGLEGSRANLYGADLSSANLYGANLTRADLTSANLCGANLNGADLSSANLYGADLSSANLTRADLTSADLSRADLTSADMSSANLYGADLSSANLTRADLTSADLSSANLYGARGNLKHLKSVFCETYPVTYTAEVMQIGCERHKIEDWWGFDDERILEMDGKKALEWWRTWKPILQQIVAASPATKSHKRSRA